MQFTKAIKAKDTPWDAVLTGSVVCTVVTNVSIYLIFRIVFTFFYTNIFCNKPFL